MNRYKLLFLPIIFCLLIGCSSDDKEPLADASGSIAGSVSDMTTGEPVQTVNVVLNPGGKQTVTGTDGNFSFLNLKPGDYSLEIKKDGYESNNAVISVSANEIAQAHLLIERLPAVITTDRTLLEFGEELTTLSFAIVNRGYTELTFRVEKGNCSWISVNPEEENIKAGQTTAIVVTINRELLASGANEAVLVVKSLNGGGNTEIKVTAIGEYRAQSAVNTLEPSDITSSSAVLNGEITNEGAPKYTERGFIWNTSQEMTLTSNTGHISVPVNDNKLFSSKIENLLSTQTYYARSYCKQNGQIIYGNIVAFSMSATSPKVETSSATNISSTSATLNGTVLESGTPAYTERGFCIVSNSYADPTVSDTKIVVSGSGQGNYSAQLTNLEYDTSYNFRAYVIQGGKAYYGTTCYFSTSFNEANVVTSNVTNINYTSATLNGTIANPGDPAITERGFCYSTNSYPAPTVSDNRIRVNGVATGAFKADIDNLEEDQTYYVRAYAIQNGEPIYGSTVNFTTYLTPMILTGPVRNVSESSLTEWQATFVGLVADGNPQVTEYGFVYSTNTMPTVNNSTKVQGTNAKYLTEYDAYQFERKITNLQNYKTYYVRAYAKTSLGYFYGETESFSTF
ncbi:MAG: carboxypeptidase regulatory-like domain-containing protein [Bacteroidales bacterium]|nr:carboxypeptidase regulatory-like domain-containing protein [Bacteroidales bacterium]MBD5364136.1 carboxypeptidase regulatory-like domain-containing protein [Bacteroides sp.]